MQVDHILGQVNFHGAPMQFQRFSAVGQVGSPSEPAFDTWFAAMVVCSISYFWVFDNIFDAQSFVGQRTGTHLYSSIILSCTAFDSPSG